MDFAQFICTVAQAIILIKFFCSRPHINKLKLTHMVSVIAVVLNYNDAGNTLECLESVNRSDFGDIKTILVDNGSTDDSVGVIAIAMPTVEIVSSSHNLGF